MPNNKVLELIAAVKNMHDDLITLKTDFAWVKRGMLGIYASIGVGAVTLVTALLMHR